MRLTTAMQPVVDGGNHALAGTLDGPGVWRGVVVAEKALHGGLGGLPTGIGTAHTIGNDQRSTTMALAGIRQTNAQGILIAGFDAGKGALGNAELKCVALIGVGHISSLVS